jgi:LysR family hydrogen peroxide-inducible transcriptional activator
MELVQLRNFLRVAEQRNFTKAARSCGVSQPALSQQVARLEEELGCPVFERQGRQLKLTEAGELLRRRAQQILGLVDDTAKQLRDDGLNGRVVVAAIPTVAPYLLPRVFRTFRERFPAARLEVNEEVTERLLKRCQSGDVDLGLLALPVEVQHLEVEPLFDEPLLLALTPGHRLASRESIRLDEIRDEPFILLDEAHCLSGHIRSFCARRKFQPVATGRTSQLATVQELVALGHGISLVPEMARRVDASDARVYRPIAGTPPTRTIAVCWNPYRYRSRLTQAFLDLLREP